MEQLRGYILRLGFSDIGDYAGKVRKEGDLLIILDGFWYDDKCTFTGLEEVDRALHDIFGCRFLKFIFSDKFIYEWNEYYGFYAYT